MTKEQAKTLHPGDIVFPAVDPDTRLDFGSTVETFVRNFYMERDDTGKEIFPEAYDQLDPYKHGLKVAHVTFDEYGCTVYCTLAAAKYERARYMFTPKEIKFISVDKRPDTKTKWQAQVQIWEK